MLCGVLEDEMHFLIDCQKFDGKARADLLNRCFILNSSFYFLNSLDMFRANQEFAQLRNAN